MQGSGLELQQGLARILAYCEAADAQTPQHDDLDPKDASKEVPMATKSLRFLHQLASWVYTAIQLGLGLDPGY